MMTFLLVNIAMWDKKEIHYTPKLDRLSYCLKKGQSYPLNSKEQIQQETNQKTGFPTYSIICGSLRWLRHLPPRFDFVFSEVGLLIRSSVGTPWLFFHPHSRSAEYTQTAQQNTRHSESETHTTKGKFAPSLSSHHRFYLCRKHCTV